MWCGVLARERAEQPDRVERVIEREPAGEVDLITLTGANQLDDRGDARFELRAAEAAAPRASAAIERDVGAGAVPAVVAGASDGVLECGSRRPVADQLDAVGLRTDDRAGVEASEHEIRQRGSRRR